MAAKTGGTGGDGEMGIVLMVTALVLGVFFGAAYLYHHHTALINSIAEIISRFQLFLFMPFSPTAQKVWEVMNTHPPESLTWDQEAALLSISGSYFRWVAAPLIMLMGYVVYRNLGKIEMFQRQFQMKSLLIHNANHFAALRPVAFRKRLITEEPSSTGPWRVMESPMLFALRQGIILDAEKKQVKEEVCFTSSGLPRVNVTPPAGGFYFDDARAIEVFTGRMGPKFPGIAGLKDQPRWMRGLIGAFCAIAIGQKEQGSAILDAMSTSFDEDLAVASQNENGVPGDFDLDIADADEWIKRTFRKRDINETDVESDLAAATKSKLANNSLWLYVWLGVLLRTARLHGGSTPPNEFIWLRPANRELWYFLTAIGGNTVSPEGNAPWSHLLAEEVLGSAIPVPQVEEAASALRRAIDAEGWFDLGREDKK